MTCAKAVMYQKTKTKEVKSMNLSFLFAFILFTHEQELCNKIEGLLL